MAETIGWLADKLSIIELKIYHQLEQMQRTDITQGFREQCGERVSVLRMQRDDLASELSALMADIAASRVVPRVYRQFKMYNDPRYRMGEAGGDAAKPL
ncbi:MAG: DUF4254 domain-containing protein [Gemmatimonadaceae bacterium]